MWAVGALPICATALLLLCLLASLIVFNFRKKNTAFLTLTTVQKYCWYVKVGQLCLCSQMLLPGCVENGCPFCHCVCSFVAFERYVSFALAEQRIQHVIPGMCNCIMGGQRVADGWTGEIRCREGGN